MWQNFISFYLCYYLLFSFDEDFEWFFGVQIGRENLLEPDGDVVLLRGGAVVLVLQAAPPTLEQDRTVGAGEFHLERISRHHVGRGRQ